MKAKSTSTTDKEMREAYIRARKEKARRLRLEREAKREAAKAAKKAAKAAKAREAREKHAAEQRQRYLSTTQGVEVSWDVHFASVSDGSDASATQTPLYLDIWRAPATADTKASSAVHPPTPQNEQAIAKDTETSMDMHSKRTILPVIIWLHGGGWRYGSHHFLPKFLRPLLFGNGDTTTHSSRRFAIVSVGYRKSTQAPFPACVHDCKAAVRWVRAKGREHYLDSRHIAVVGSSSGGHLALMLALTHGVATLEGTNLGHGGQSSNVHCAVAFAPPTHLRLDKTPDVLAVPNSHEARLLGVPCMAKASESLVSAASPLSHANRLRQSSVSSVPVLIIHGDADDIVHPNQTRRLASALNGADVSGDVGANVGSASSVCDSDCAATSATAATDSDGGSGGASLADAATGAVAGSGDADCGGDGKRVTTSHEVDPSLEKAAGSVVTGGAATEGRCRVLMVKGGGHLLFGMPIAEESERRFARAFEEVYKFLSDA